MHAISRRPRTEPVPLHQGVADIALKRRLSRDLADATARDHFMLHYQPMVDLESGQIVGRDAQLRWPHRRQGMIPQGVFLQLADATGLVTRIGGWGLATACRDLAGGEGSVSIEIAGRQLTEGVLLEQVAVALEASGLAPERLELALAENLLAELLAPAAETETLLTLAAIRDLGVGLAVDAFGATLAGLAPLRRLPLTALRLDRALVQDLPASREDAAIVRAVIETAHVLGVSVTAEAVDTEAQRAFLSAAGCDQGQGALFGPAAEWRGPTQG